MFIWYKRHVRIPQKYTVDLIHNILLNLNENIADNIQCMLKTILEQNYFQWDNQFYEQKHRTCNGCANIHNSGWSIFIISQAQPVTPSPDRVPNHGILQIHIWHTTYHLQHKENPNWKHVNRIQCTTFFHNIHSRRNK